MNNYLIVADDFTGSNDTGVQIRRRGIPVRVVFSASGISGRESCVLDTETRWLPEAEASGKLLSEGEKIPYGNFHHVIKKVDSTLRGNIGSETKALAQSYCPELIIFAPALPDMGRTTVGRVHCLNGTPICKTELTRDPKSPVRLDNIQKILADVFDEEVFHVGLEELRSDSVRLEGARVFSFDAVTNDDIRIIVRTVLATKKRVLWVGSAGLADNLLSIERVIPPALAVVGSLSSVTRDQVLFAEKQGISLVKVPLYAILEKKTAPEEVAGAAVSLLKAGKDVILLSSSTYSSEEYQRSEESAGRAGLSVEAMSAYTQKILGQIAIGILEGVKISGLFLSGGDTAMSCFEYTGSVGTRIETEIATGIPLMRLIGGQYEGLKVVTKAGAFGKEDAVFYALRKLREAEDLP